MAQIIKTTGEIIEVTPKNGTDFTLEEMQEIVGGYIEVAYLADNQIMILNEEGKLYGLEYNAQATDIYQNNVTPYDVVVGDVLVCDREQVK